MARRRSFSSSLNQLARASVRIQREAERKRKARQRELERQERLQQQYQRKLEIDSEKARKQSIKEQKEFEKEQKALYLQSRKDETSELNADVEATLFELENTLSHSLKYSGAILFESLYRHDSYPPFQPPAPSDLPENPEPNRDDYFRDIQATPSNFAEKVFGIGKKSRLERMNHAEEAYKKAVDEHERLKSVIYSIRKEDEFRTKKAREQYELDKDAFIQELTRINAEIDVLKEKYFALDKESVETYNEMVLEASEYLSEFPQEFELYYVEDSKELVLQYELPTAEKIVPKHKEYKYVQTKDEIRGTEFKPKEINEIYSKLIASIALRTLHELFAADQANAIDSIVFNGFVNTVDPRTGLEIQPCIITIQTQKVEFTKFDLSKVDVIECVKGLRAHISPSLSELSPVKPIVDFNMLDRRFIDERDVLSSLDDRMNLLEMDPFEFEHLICNLFSKIGLESKLTRSSRDGGIDVVAFDPRPVFGGKYVIQAKRYRNTVEVAAVRDLYGAMMNENAAKGILVTTSTFGPDARSFAKDKPIELIDGNNLLYMLEQIGVNVKIVIPK